MASPRLSPPPNHSPTNNHQSHSTSRISASHLLAVQTSSTALQAHLGLNNPHPYALPPPLPHSKPPNLPLGLYARLQTPPVLPGSGPGPARTTTSMRALTFTDTKPSVHDLEIGREGLLKRVVVGEGGVREVRCGSVMVGEGEGEKWVFVSVVWEREGGRGRGGGEGGSGARRGRRMCFALPERGVERLEGLGSGDRVQVEGAGSSLRDIDTTRTASFSALFSSGGVPVFEFADVDVDMDEGKKEGEGGFDAQREDEVEGEDEAEGEAEAEGEGEGEGMDGVEAGIEGEERSEDDGDREGEIEGEVKVDGEGHSSAGTEGDGDGEEEEEWRSVKRAMGRGSCLVRFYV